MRTTSWDDLTPGTLVKVLGTKYVFGGIREGVYPFPIVLWHWYTGKEYATSEMARFEVITEILFTEEM